MVHRNPIAPALFAIWNHEWLLKQAFEVRLSRLCRHGKTNLCLKYRDSVAYNSRSFEFGALPWHAYAK
jgi:hypothetical protein